MSSFKSPYAGQANSGQSSGSPLSNGSQQTRGLSAGDWTRLQRLRGAKTAGYGATGDLVTNADLAPTEASEIPRGKALLIPYEAAGFHRIVRPASKWTDYIASQRADYVTQGRTTAPDGTVLNGSTLSVTQLCSCTTTVLNTKTGVCRSCFAPRYAITYPSGSPYTGINPAIPIMSVFKRW